MAITVEDFPALTDKLDSIFNEVASRAVERNTGFEIFDVFDVNQRKYDHLVLHGVSGVRKVTPGEDLPKISSAQGDTISWTQEYFGGIVDVTKEMRKFDMYGEIEGIVRSITQDAFDKVDQSLADRLLGGFSSTYVDPYGVTRSANGPDGETLFSDSHTNPITDATYSNLCVEGTTDNAKLSRQAIIDTRLEASTHTDPNGIMRPINLDTLLVPPHLEDMAERIVKSQYLPGTNDNDVNPLYGKVNIVVWPRLAQNSEGTDKSDNWFLIDSSGIKESLKCLFAERPGLDAPNQVYSNKNWEYSLDFFYAVGNGYPAYIFGSDASESA